ncbi:hypothetical protein [Alkalicoccus luteus]|uniref:DUF3953 domain-containing protein n=1 Tax=Alkalicoccus luteus TaxID=1237094 RepID=A0A969TUQ0_9BACI|nr:hypothetical protein [Alkalicoccus luteus]NJP37570.1 hypothetical protein [Alkalicoccus luteus]
MTLDRIVTILAGIMIILVLLSMLTPFYLPDSVYFFILFLFSGLYAYTKLKRDRTSFFGWLLAVLAFVSFAVLIRILLPL